MSCKFCFFICWCILTSCTVVACKEDGPKNNFYLQCEWFESVKSSQILSVVWARSMINCWIHCLSTLGCLQINHYESNSTCKLIKDIPKAASSLSQGATKQWFLKDKAVVQTYVHDKPISSQMNRLISDQVHLHVITSTNFDKKKTDTNLRVTWFGDGGLTTFNDSIYGSKTVGFFFRFNNQKCSSPCAVDFGQWTPTSGSMIWPISLEGVCQQLQTGPVVIELLASLPVNHSTVANISAWSVSRHYQGHLQVDEIEVQPNLLTLAHKPSIHQTVHTTNCATGQSYIGLIEIGTTFINKKHIDTALYVRFSFNARSFGNNVCTRYFVTFNGNECTSPGKLVAPHWSYNSSVGIHSGTTIGGICENLSAGAIQVRVKTGNCRGGYIIGNHHATWVQKRFLSVEEVTLRQTVPDDLSTNFNLNYHYWQGESVTNNGIITASVTTYNKASSSSTLRIRYLGTLGSYGSSVGKYASVWCFKVDQNHCSNPDKMCAEHYTDKPVLYAHQRPFQLIGICKGLPRRKYNISLVVELYAGMASSPVVKTGFTQSTSNFLIIEELQMKDAS